MSIFLRNISIKGIKNLYDEVTLTFSKKDIKKFSELRKYNIKAIYGPNGSGKTAIVHAFQIFQDIILDDGYLYDSDNSKYLYELMNKSCSTISIKTEFFHSEKKEKPSIYTYEVYITYKQSGFEIVYEKYAKRVSEYAKNTVIVESKDGEFIAYDLPEAIKDNYTNLLKKRSFADVTLELSKKTHIDNDYKIQNMSEDLKDSINTISPLYEMVFGLNVILDTKDDHSNAILKSNEKLIKFFKWHQKNQELTSNLLKIGYNSKLLTKKELKEFEEENVKREKFVRLFKPNINRIEVQSKLAESYKKNELYMVNELVDYGGYKIDLELESVGIKKLLNLYTSIRKLTSGEILVIDELDSHINDVYLIKLIEYVSEYTQGQLIFTTHNVSPMDTLKTKKHSIDFMSMTGKLTSWTQLGNYSPSRLYKSGMVKGLPFNIEPEAFLGVFTDGE